MGVGCHPPGYLPDPGIEPVSLRSPALAGRFFTTCDTWEAEESIRPCENIKGKECSIEDSHVSDSLQKPT